MGAPRLRTLSDKVIGYLPPLPRLFSTARPSVASGLTPAQRQTYARDGFLIFDPQVPAARIDQAVRDLEPRWPKSPEESVGSQRTGRVQDAWRQSRAVRKLATAQGVRAVLWDLYGREPLPFQTINFYIGSEQPVHSDTMHFNSKPAGYMCGVWIALEAMTADNGPLLYYPGSHRLPEYTFKDTGVPASEQGVSHAYAVYERFLVRKIEELGLQPRQALLKKGQALIWASNLWHGGSPRRDRTRSRLSQVTHYFFAGCKYYTPLLSTDERTHWRRPNWIR